jgi:hypothetical protein
VLVTLDRESFESALPDMSAEVVMSQLTAHVRGHQPVHPAAQVAIVAGSEGEVEVVRHEAVSQNSHRDSKRCLGHDPEKRLIVVGLVEHLGTCVAAIEDMIRYIRRQNHGLYEE